MERCIVDKKLSLLSPSYPANCERTFHFPLILLYFTLSLFVKRWRLITLTLTFGELSV